MPGLFRNLNVSRIVFVSFLLGSLFATINVFGWDDGGFVPEGWSCVGTTSCPATSGCSTPTGGSTPTCTGTSPNGTPCMISCISGGSF